jgi:hypothetical protein
VKDINPDIAFFCVDLEKERSGYYFNNAPDFIDERFMTKIFSVCLTSYGKSVDGDKIRWYGEIDVDEFFKKLNESKIKADSFYPLFLNHGKSFLPKFGWTKI